MRLIVFLIMTSAALLFSGCSNNEQLGGTVTFADGKTVPTGTVIFSTTKFQARGEIESDGTYRLSSLNPNDGLPPGEYKVCVTGVLKRTGGANNLAFNVKRRPIGKKSMAPFVSLCAEKYGNPETSGLSCTVPAPDDTFDIVLEPHPKNYP